MDELGLRQIFIGLINTSLLLSVSGCGGSTAGDAPADGERDLQGGTATAGSGGAPYASGGAGGVGSSGAGGIGSGGSGGSPVGTGPLQEPLPSTEPFWPDLALDEFALPTCQDEEWRPVQGLQPAAPVDHLSLRRILGRSSVEVLDATGTACSGATDPAACEQAISSGLAAIKMEQLCYGPPSNCQHVVVATVGDRVELLSTKQQLAAFLAPIDTPAEALLLVNDETFMGYHVTCDRPEFSSVRTVSDGYDVVTSRMTSDCQPIVTQRELLHVASDGSVTVLRTNIAAASRGCVGRRPEGLGECVVTEPQPALAAFFSGIAFLEAASVTAFTRLAAELTALGAPPALAQSALRASRDEVRHAAQTRRVAERFGGQVPAPEVAALEGRDLERVACENAAEGCVRETFGALIAHHQARHARDPEIREMMLRIAEDETRHAALAWRVAAWAEPRLSPAQREQVAAARASALAALRVELEVALPAELCEVAGMPSSSGALALFAGLERQLWQREPAAVS